MEIELGTSVKDLITGFGGIVTGRVEYITGCAQYLVQPKCKIDGTTIGAEWIDEHRLKSIKAKKIVLNSDSNDGACDSAPIK